MVHDQLLLLLVRQGDYMSAGFKVTGSELVEHAWLNNFLDAQTNTIASGTRPTRTTNMTDEYTSMLHSVDSEYLRPHQQQQQQQPQCVHSEHSYSLDNDNGVDFIKIEPEEHGVYRTTAVTFKNS